MHFSGLPEFQNFWPTANNAITDSNPLFNEKVFEKLNSKRLTNITALCSHQLPTAYFSTLVTLKVENCGKLRNLMSPFVARGLLNLRKLVIIECQSMKEVITEEVINRIQQGTVSTLNFESVKNDDELKIVDLNKAMFNSKVSCPNLEVLELYEANSLTALCPHQLPTAYFSKLVTLKVLWCGKLRNLMSPSMVRGLLNLRKLWIISCQSVEEVIAEEEQQGEEIMTKEPLFPRLENLYLKDLPKLGHFILTKRPHEFPFLKEAYIRECPKMKTFILHGTVSCPNLEELFINGAHSIPALCSHQLPTAYFRRLEKLEIDSCEKLRNLMSPSVARGVLKLRKLKIENCPLMEEVITAAEEEGEEMSNEPLFPLLEKLCLYELSKLGHFFWTKRALEFPFLRVVKIRKCPEMKTFVQQGSVSTLRLEIVNYDDEELKVDDVNEWIHQRFNSKEEDGSESKASIE